MIRLPSEKQVALPGTAAISATAYTPAVTGNLVVIIRNDYQSYPLLTAYPVSVFNPEMESEIG
jgi:hypothetical protein